MAETSPLAIYMSTGIEQKAHYINPKFVQLFGYTIEDVPTVGQWWPRACPDEKYRQQIIEEWQDKVKRAIETNTPIEPLDVTVTCKDGSTKNVIWGFTSLGDTNYAYGLDITERKRAEDAQRKALEELSRTNDELTRFSYLVSHDLRSPVVTIKAFLAYLEEDVATQDAERMGKDLGYIRTAADKMSQLLDELLNLSRVGRKVNPPEEVPLQVVVKEAMDMVAGQIAERGVQVQVTEEPILLYGDRPRLVEIFQNLLDNACKFMGDQTAPRVEIGAELAGDEPLLFVRDNGIGIDPRHHPKIFGLFEKLDPRAEGTGLGLALVRRMVEVHGGKIWVESAGPGMGTTFRFTLDGTKRVST
jgi:signal transduction histidine kinase